MKMLPRLFLFIAIFSMLSSFAFASVAVWSGDGFDNLASNASNWAGNAVPLSGDDVIFDNTSTKDCTWDINETPFSFSINGGYEGCVSVISTLILSPGPLQLNPIFPFQGLSTITNTPSTGALDPNPFLIDGNMTGSAGINIGVPPLGGDSRPRNIGLDFFTATWINTLFVWIDRDQLPDGISNSFSWEVYTSFDNVDWTRLPALTSAAFIQLESRFEIYFPNINARYVKAVVSPLTPAAAASYPTFPNPDMIFVTELQAFLASHTLQ